ncbi:lipid A export permease/ATP-binding protein MsbA [Aquabacterium sp.]|uniref:lipid A export permease/ATP-binding protein MsbA n=1 Tax=Aquabacterium sp. TaxID=1872578 RepID=UPI002601F1A8|nr:lipid A export permease/ATP-binding protein MsbA [Aquabacterium sp.]MDD2976738.1 lipid A export permease/ATP-binding protein MsbA [Aquabacterium sp.]
MTQSNQTELYLRLLRCLRPHWHIFALGVLAMVLYAATETAIPLLLKELLDGSFAKKSDHSLHTTPLLLVGLFVARGLTDYLHTTALNIVANKVVLDLRTQMFDKLLRLPTSYFDSTTNAALISQFTYNTLQITPLVNITLITLVKDTLTVFGLLGYMLWMNWQLSLAFFMVLPLIGWTIRSVSKRLRALSQSQQTTIGALSHVLDEVISGHREIRIFGSERYEAKRFYDVANAIRRYTMKVVTTAAANGPVVQIIAVLALAGIIYYASLQSSMNQLTVGGFVSFFGAMALLLSPLKRLSNVNENLQRGLAAARTVFDFIDTPAEPQEGTEPLPRATGHLRFENVGFHYPNAEKAALSGINLEIKPGETLALVGASGSGKSTLMSLIPRFYPLTEGRILLDGIDIHDIQLADLRANIGLVTQNVVLFNDTIAANIAYGQPDVDEQAIRQAAKAANALEFIDALPLGLATEIGENGARLSGGQRQRISIARALLKNAPILLLDEATSALDTGSERAVQEALENARRGRTTIVIAHRLSTIVNADRIVVMQQGRITEVGSHEELLAKQGTYSQLHAMQFAH